MTERRYNASAPRGSHAAKLGKVYLDKPGYYAIRMVKGGPEVAAEVTYGPSIDPADPSNPMDRSFWWTVLANGSVYRGPSQQIDWLLIGRPISKADYDFLLADRQWASAHAPHSPEANPREGIDLSQVDPASLF